MNSKLENTKNANEVKVEITVEAEKFDAAIKKVYFKSAKYFNIPGFRKGKAPMQIVEKYDGKDLSDLNNIKDLEIFGKDVIDKGIL